MKHASSWFLFLYLIITCSACSKLSQKIHPTTIDSKTAESEILLAEIRLRNDSLKTFKGTGKVSILKDGRSYRSKVAWIGAAPEKLRVEMIGSPGQPKMGFSCDGQWFYYYDHKDEIQPVKRISAEDSSLRRFISIPISSQNVVSLLSGRVPAYEYHSSEIKKADASGGYVLVLNKKWWVGSQKIFLGSNRKEIERIEIHHGNTMRYQIEFDGMRFVKRYLIPKALIITDDEGTRFQLDIERFWVNAEISPDLFVLKPPKQ